MVIFGHYETDQIRVPRPRIRGYVNFTRLGVQGMVDFLVDSGADSVIIHPADVRNIGILQRTLRENSVRESVGIGGRQKYFTESGSISFADGQFSYVRCYLDICIAGDDISTTSERVPSILGRDFLNLCDVRLNYSTALVALQPVSANDYGEISFP